MVRQRTKHGQAGQPDCIDHEFVARQRDGWLIFTPGDTESIEDADGELIAADPSVTWDIEEAL
jgi:hypothetical protein